MSGTDSPFEQWWKDIEPQRRNWVTAKEYAAAAYEAGSRQLEASLWICGSGHTVYLDPDLPLFEQPPCPWCELEAGNSVYPPPDAPNDYRPPRRTRA